MVRRPPVIADSSAFDSFADHSKVIPQRASHLSRGTPHMHDMDRKQTYVASTRKVAGSGVNFLTEGDVRDAKDNEREERDTARKTMREADVMANKALREAKLRLELDTKRQARLRLATASANKITDDKADVGGDTLVKPAVGASSLKPSLYPSDTRASFVASEAPKVPATVVLPVDINPSTSKIAAAYSIHPTGVKTMSSKTSASLSGSATSDSGASSEKHRLPINIGNCVVRATYSVNPNARAADTSERSTGPSLYTGYPTKYPHNSMTDEARPFVAEQDKKDDGIFAYTNAASTIKTPSVTPDQREDDVHGAMTSTAPERTFGQDNITSTIGEKFGIRSCRVSRNLPELRTASFDKLRAEQRDEEHAEFVGTLPEGISLPAKPVREDIERVAKWVARAGIDLETLLWTQKSGISEFLDPKNELNAFYKWRVSECQAGRSTDMWMNQNLPLGTQATSQSTQTAGAATSDEARGHKAAVGRAAEAKASAEEPYSTFERHYATTAPRDNSAGDLPVGMRLPCPAVRETIEKVAKYVCRSGPGFEDHVRQINALYANNPTPFLNSSDKDYPYYQWRLGKVKAKKQEEVPKASSTAHQSHLAIDGSDQWTSAMTVDGRTYYYNKLTRQTSWISPGCVTVPEVSATMSVSKQEVYALQQSLDYVPSSMQVKLLPLLAKLRASEESASSGGDQNDTIKVLEQRIRHLEIARILSEMKRKSAEDKEQSQQHRLFRPSGTQLSDLQAMQIQLQDQVDLLEAHVSNLLAESQGAASAGTPAHEEVLSAKKATPAGDVQNHWQRGRSSFAAHYGYEPIHLSSKEAIEKLARAQEACCTINDSRAPSSKDESSAHARNEHANTGTTYPAPLNLSFLDVPSVKQVPQKSDAKSIFDNSPLRPKPSSVIGMCFTCGGFAGTHSPYCWDAQG